MFNGVYVWTFHLFKYRISFGSLKFFFLIIKSAVLNWRLLRPIPGIVVFREFVGESGNIAANDKIFGAK